jgi:TatA/E family protein of Tat protein translocase
VWKEAMFNLGPLEIVAIFVVALLVLGPDKLPEMGKQVGKAVREFRKFQESMQTQVRDVIEPITGPMVSNGPVGPVPTNPFRDNNVPRSATIQDPTPPEGEAAEPPGTYGHYAPVADPAAAGETPPGDGAAPANGALPHSGAAPTEQGTAPSGEAAPPAGSSTDPDAG